MEWLSNDFNRTANSADRRIQFTPAVGRYYLCVSVSQRASESLGNLMLKGRTVLPLSGEEPRNDTANWYRHRHLHKRFVWSFKKLT